MTVILYTNPWSRGRIARWMLEETGIAYETVALAYGPDGTKAADYRAINPMGKVPALRHDGHVVTEAAAICAYLADAFPEAGLAPAPADRADYYRWLFFAAGPLEAAVTNHVNGWDPAPERQSMFGYGTYDATIDTLDAFLTGRDHVTGGKFSAADLYLGAAVIWGTGFGTIPERPSFLAYAERLTARPGYKRATELDDALAAKIKGEAS